MQNKDNSRSRWDSDTEDGDGAPITKKSKVNNNINDINDDNSKLDEKT